MPAQLLEVKRRVPRVGSEQAVRIPCVASNRRREMTQPIPERRGGVRLQSLSGSRGLVFPALNSLIALSASFRSLVAARGFEKLFSHASSSARSARERAKSK